ncbi:hypothetical protein [Paenibacillus monticola]|uniref:Uncharacterized protein n=1 Tax=Paenibacillus monticola TaxID=2666075 RepID=A0A7X2HCB0_9BACL|nr:hypothetical protein [Paenibacillus monticola]MRN56823.1 hypothetical protein [Paenibacillus monticola]
MSEVPKKNKVFMDKVGYLQEFSGERRLNNDKQYEALKMALDIRKFEIELYWKRATYFWTFIGVTFAGYFLLINGNVSTAERLRSWHILIVTLLGLLFSFSWFLVNRGSKFWQNNWERHVDYLEDDIMGPLYKTVINPQKNKFINPFAEYPLSVSKINQFLSLLVSIIWSVLVFDSLKNTLTKVGPWQILLIELGSVVIIIYGYYYFCRSKLVEKNFKNKEAMFVKRNIQ